MNYKFFNKIILFVVLLICSVAILCSCVDNEVSPEKTPAYSQTAAPTATPDIVDTTAEYCVSVKDYYGKPFSGGVVVSFMKGEQQVAMQTINSEGNAIKQLEKDDYTIKLMFTGDESLYHYKTDDIKLSASVTSAEVLIAKKLTGTPTVIYANDQEYNVYFLKEGSNYSSIESGKRNYFLFKPAAAGLYKFSVQSKDITIGYYGGTHFIQDNNVAEIFDDTSFSMNIYSSMIGTTPDATITLVVGVDTTGDVNECIIGVERVGAPAHSYEDEPWTTYEATVDLHKYILPNSSILGEFDLTASTQNYNLVFNTADGFYHLNSVDGPLVLVRLSKASKYLAPFKTILETTDVVKYFFDDNENFIKRERYGECLLQYIENADDKEGVYPLTKDLMYIIQQSGDYLGWFDPNHSVYLFKDNNGVNIPGINNDISWLFMCCYIK